MNAYLKYFFLITSVILSRGVFGQVSQVDVAVDFPATSAEIRLENVTSPYNWQMSTKPEEYLLLPTDGISVPIRTKTEEFLLSDPKVGVFRFFNGMVTSATRTQQDQAVPKSPANCVYPCPYIYQQKYRPTLFVSIGGFNLERAGVAEWQILLNNKLMKLSLQLPYKHFAVDWESNKQTGPQVVDAVEVIKQYLAAQPYPWNVVLIGYSRGGIFAQDLSLKLAGAKNIKNLHVALLDPTAAPIFGDLYPTQKVSGVLGYLKFDGLPFFYASISTVSDKTIAGYNNYGMNNFQTLYCASCSAPESHSNYAYDWISNDFDQLISQVQNSNDMSNYSVSEASGMDVLTLSSSDLNAQLDATCVEADQASCTVSGSITLGPLTTVSVRNVISKSGVDVSVAAAVASATAIIRRDQIAVEQSTLTSEQSVLASSSGIYTTTDVFFGSGEVRTKIDKYGGSVSINVGKYNVAEESIGPIDAIIPGISSTKSKLKKLRKLSPF